MELSTYQTQIIDYFTNNPHNNMKINALAGVGKTFILERLIERSSSYDAYIAFNNSIAEEFREKVKNPKTKVTTIHALAYSIMNYNLTKKPETSERNEFGIVSKKGIGVSRGKEQKAELDNLKIYKIIDDIIYDSVSKKIDFREAMFYKENFVNLYNLCRLTSSELTIDSTEYIIQQYNLFQDFENEFERLSPETTIKWIKEIDQISLGKFERSNTIDFTDMLYITYLKVKSGEWEVPYWGLFTNIFVDECQDFSNLQLNFLKYIKRNTGRYVFCGDFFQSIYAFSGANANSFALVSKMFTPIVEFDLPINYRCPVSHLARVNSSFSIPIKARPNAPEGSILTINKEEVVKYVKPGDMVISRKNKWLSSLVLDLIDHGIPIFWGDKDGISAIKKAVLSVKASTLIDLQEKLEKKVKKYMDKLSSTLSSSDNSKEQKESATDKMTTVIETNSKLDNIQFALDILKGYIKNTINKGEYKTPVDFSEYLDKILNTSSSKDAVRLTSVHKAKGLEANSVFVLNEAKVCVNPRNSKEQNIQEVNLSYISITRSKDKLYLVREKDAGKEK